MATQGPAGKVHEESHSTTLENAAIITPVAEQIDHTKNDAKHALIGDTTVREEKEEGEWSTVTPGKASRNPGKKHDLEFGQVTVLSPSQFSILSNSEQVEELLGNATTEIVGNEKIIDGTSEQNKGADKETEDVQPCLESENNDKDA